MRLQLTGCLNGSMTAWAWVQRSLPLLPCFAALTAVHVCGRAGQPAVGSRAQQKLVAPALARFCAVKLATILASHAIVAYGLGG